MSEFNRPENIYAQSGVSLNAYITKLFTIMGIGVALTAVIAFLGYNSMLNGGFLANRLMETPMAALLSVCLLVRSSQLRLLSLRKSCLVRLVTFASPLLYLCVMSGLPFVFSIRFLVACLTRSLLLVFL